MTANETIAIWLKLKCSKIPHLDGVMGLYLDEKDKKWQLFDFLHDRNQQKWIEEKLIEIDASITYNRYGKSEKWQVHIITGDCFDGKNHILNENESKDTAFISAVLELIEKENESNSPK